MAGEARRTLPTLLATADRALYRAKADRRNRVSGAPLVVVDVNEGETTQRLRDRAASLPPSGRWLNASADRGA